MTELQHAIKAASTRPRIQPAEEGDRRPLSVSARLGRLQFHNSGKFRVLQLTDIQDGPKIGADTIKLIEASLDATRPDIVVFTGNQIAGYDAAYASTMRKRQWSRPNGSVADRERYSTALEHTRDLVRATIGQLTRPLIERGVPWAVTFGNHDFQCGLGDAEIEAICKEFPGCLNPGAAESSGTPRGMADDAAYEASRDAACDGSADAARNGFHDGSDDGASNALPLPEQRVYACEPGTFALPVADAGRTRDVLGLVLLDSGDYARSGGYGSPSAVALRFLADAPHRMASSGMDTLPCMVFQHFALAQYYQLLKPAAANAAHAIEGYRGFAGRHYTLDEDRVQAGGYLGEGVSCPDADSGEFTILRNNGYFAISAGHDHRNAFVGTMDGVMMIASPTSGFGSYGPVPAKRAARLIEFDIRHPYQPRTQLLEYGELVGKPSAGKAYIYGMTSESKPDSEGMDLLHRPTWWSKLLSWVRR